MNLGRRSKSVSTSQTSFGGEAMVRSTSTRITSPRISTCTAISGVVSAARGIDTHWQAITDRMCKKWRRTHDIFRSVCETINVELRVPLAPEQCLLNIFGLDAVTDDEINVRSARKSLSTRRVPCYPRFPILFLVIVATMIFTVVSTFVVPLPMAASLSSVLSSWLQRQGFQLQVARCNVRSVPLPETWHC